MRDMIKVVAAFAFVNKFIEIKYEQKSNIPSKKNKRISSIITVSS